MRKMATNEPFSLTTSSQLTTSTHSDRLITFLADQHVLISQIAKSINLAIPLRIKDYDRPAG